MALKSSFAIYKEGKAFSLVYILWLDTKGETNVLSFILSSLASYSSPPPFSVKASFSFFCCSSVHGEKKDGKSTVVFKKIIGF